MHLLSNQAQVLEAGAAYLVRVAMAWPFAAGIVRLGAVMLAGWLWAGSLAGLFWIVAASYLLFGGINLYAMASGLGWGSERDARASLQVAR